MNSVQIVRLAMDFRDLFNQQNDLFNQEPVGLHTERKKYVLTDGIDQNNANGIFGSECRTIFDPVNGPVTENTNTLHTLDCGHVVGSRGAKELQGRCQRCGVNWVCFRCASIRCFRCGRLLCTACIRVFQDAPYCNICRAAFIAKKVSLLGLKGLHHALSTEF